ncbi:GNAT family N-acetyltransferase [Bartonella sp. LJL80]
MLDYFLYTTTDDPKAKPLRDALLHEYDSRYGTFYDEQGAAAELDRYPPAAFSPPTGNFLLLMRGDETIGGGAFKFFDQQTAELKRIWTADRYRRQGLAARILAELENQAALQGYHRLYLTTGFRQPEAVGLYLKHGYTNLFDLQGDWEAYRHLPFEKDITHLVLQSENAKLLRAATHNHAERHLQLPAL